MINKLKRRFLILGTVFMFILMSVLVLIMNLVNYREVVSESDSVIDMLSQPELPFFGEQGSAGSEDISGFIPQGMSPEVPYESRFFIVTASGNTVRFELSRIISLDQETAKAYITQALESGRGRGFIGDYRDRKAEDESGFRLVFLDCGRKLDQFRSFLWISAIKIRIKIAKLWMSFLKFSNNKAHLKAPVSKMCITDNLVTCIFKNSLYTLTNNCTT